MVTEGTPLEALSRWTPDKEYLFDRLKTWADGIGGEGFNPLAAEVMYRYIKEEVDGAREDLAVDHPDRDGSNDFKATIEDIEVSRNALFEMYELAEYILGLVEVTAIASGGSSAGG